MISRVFPFILLVFVVACSPSREESNGGEDPVPVRTYRVVPSENTWRSFPGSVSAGQSADVAFEVGGTVAELVADTGDRVEEGQILARLDDGVLRSRLAAARAEAEQARKDAERARTLLAKNAIAPAQAEALETQAKAAEALADQAAEALEDAVIKAPFSGIVAARFADLSESVAAKEPVFRIHDLNAFTIAIDLPQSLVLASRQNEDQNPEDLRFRAHFQHENANVKGYEVRMDSFSPEPDERTGTYQFELILPAPADLRVLPGMTCSVRIPFSAGDPNVVYVPPSAVGATADRSPVVWVVTDSGQAARRPVTVGELTSNGLEVLEGLQPGDLIVTAGADVLTEGTPVRPL